MAATFIGTTPKWGIDDDETGLIIASLDFDFQNSNKPTLNRTGEVIGKTYYNEQVACSLKGEAPTASPYSGKLTSAIALANDVPAHAQATLTSARNNVENIKYSKAREDFQNFDISSMIHPLIAAGS